MKKLYVGNLPWNTTEDDLRELFAPMGETQSAILITDRETGRSRGFGFVELENDAADQAISQLNGTEYGGRQLKVNEAKEREPRRDGGGGGGGGGRW
jgi:RNA recognition motif-containing protein